MNVCVKCNLEKDKTLFLKKCNICNDCNNKRRREKYQNNADVREKLIADATRFKQAKAAMRREQEQKRIAELELTIGEQNTICKYCEEVKPKTRFRHNRLKCADCERDDPLEKFKRVVRSRIYCALNYKKQKHTIEYLGCDANEYLNWLCYKSEQYTLNNRGTNWHIDHVIPLSHFDLQDNDEIEIAFNWRNTMALSPNENLSKNNKIVVDQIEYHLLRLIEYHEEKNIILPQKYIDLYAKHLDAGKPLKTMLSNK